VSCAAIDKHGNKAEGSFTVSVRQAPQSPSGPPKLSLPDDRTVEGNAPGSAVVDFAVSASDAAGKPLPAPTCDHAPKSLFPVGTTTVTCSARDSAGVGASGSFAITVQDTRAPVLPALQDLPAVEASSADGAAVEFPPIPPATDVVDGAVPVNCTPPSNSVFAVGSHRVACTATDKAVNTASGGFAVVVTPRRPDLAVKSIDQAGHVGEDEFPPCTVTYTLTNRGRADAGASTTKVSVGKVDTATQKSEPLAEGESRREVVRLSDAACAPPVRVTVEADSTRLIEDAERGNNTRTDVLRPDLTIAAVEPPRTPASIAAANPTCTMTITYTIWNAGKADAPRSTTRVSVNAGGSKAVDSGLLYPDQKRSESASVGCATRASPAATPAITVTANADGKVDESDKGNNTATSP